VSAGHRNRFGHPHAEVVARLDALRIEWAETSAGALVWASTTPDRLSRWEARRTSSAPTPGDG
jgi:beta-lactamase superfamily II metal-dependent hydrolase